MSTAIAVTAFTGPVYDRWTPAVQFAGLRVAVIGTAAAAGRVVPGIVRTAEHVRVFQLEPGYVMPDWSGLIAHSASARTLLGRITLRTQVRDPWLRWQLTPHRIPSDTGRVDERYLRALQRGNCKLITWPIASVVAEGIRTADGIEHHVDAIVLA